MSKDVYQCFHEDGMKLENPVNLVLESRLKKWIEKGLVKILHNDCNDLNSYIAGRKNKVDHTIIYGKHKTEIEDKNLKKYLRKLSPAWIKREVTDRFSPDSYKVLITTHENYTLSDKSKELLKSLGYQIIYTGKKVTNKFDRGLIAQLHKQLTPVIKRVDTWCKLQLKKNDIHSLRVKGPKPIHPNNDINLKFDVRSHVQDSYNNQFNNTLEFKESKLTEFTTRYKNNSVTETLSKLNDTELIRTRIDQLTDFKLIRRELKRNNIGLNSIAWNYNYNVELKPPPRVLSAAKSWWD